LRPGSVAVVGASGSPGKAAARPVEFLRRHGWAGQVFPVNPARATVLGERAWPSLAALPIVPDHVYILTSADTALDTLRECAHLGVAVAAVLADDFLDTHPDGVRRRAELAAIVAGSSLRVLGPGSLGVATPASGFTLTANAAFADAGLPAGDIFVASQSGSAIGALLSRGQDMGLGFRGLVATGGELDLTLGEICLAAVDDPGTASFALFLENITGAQSLRAFALAAAAAGKPVLAYKLGRSAAGADLARSHTGALAGDDEAAGALLRDLGIARVRTFEALLEGQHLARAAPLRAVPLRVAPLRAPPRVCVLSTTGGGGAMAVDCLAAAGAELPGPSPETIARLRDIGVAVGHGALIDLTLAGTRYEVMKGALDIVVSAPEFDVVLAVPGSSARFHPELAVKPIADCAATAPKPLAAFVVPSAPDALRTLRASGVSAFRTPESCADAIVAIFARRPPRPSAARLATDAPSTAHPAAGRPTADGPSRSAPFPLPGAPGALLDEADSYAVLTGLGVAHAPYAIVPADDLPAELPVPGPVAVKILAPGLAHKSDAGGVILGVTDGAGLRSAATQITAALSRLAPGVPAGRLLVQTMVHGAGDALIGFRRDVHAGPLVLLAAGGVAAELYADRSVRLAPVDVATAHEMIAEITAFQLLAGYRGAQPGDLDALAVAVVAISRLALIYGDDVAEAEVNPLIVMPGAGGVVAVDAVVRCAPAPSEPPGRITS
jgi:acyl-CoA synthetase (NDP forming)